MSIVFDGILMRNIVIHLVGLSGAVSIAAGAQASCGKLGDRDLFAAHQNNYVLFRNWMHNNGWAGADEGALRAQYSFKYSVSGCPRSTAQVRDGSASDQEYDWHVQGRADYQDDGHEIFLAYTGQFDFYMSTRPSGPVINRLSNPGIHWRLPRSWLWQDVARNTAVVLSYEHRSDGQVFEPTEGTGPEVAQRAYDGRDRWLFDTISRGSNYFGIHADGDTYWVDRRIDLSVNLKFYTSQDSAITWGPLRDRGLRVSDYDRVWVNLGMYADQWGYWELAWRIGDRGLAGDSFDLGWQKSGREASIVRLPLYIHAHFGPMNTLSNYTQRQNSLGIGLRFSNF